MFTNLKGVVNFIFELNQLKRQKHIGWSLTGVKDGDTVAEHVWRAAQIGYLLAHMEGNVNPEKVVILVVFHDNAEARIGDQHKVGARYFKLKEAEKNATTEQVSNLGNKIKKELLAYFDEYENRTSKEGIIAMDANWLEMAFQAKEYISLGYKDCQNWIDNVTKAVETESAKKILKELNKTNFTDWWKNLKKMTYTKLDNNS